MESQIKLPITKFDAAKRQLETAIRLWFYSGDPVSIHTLVAAAHQVLHDLNKKHGGRPSMRDAKAYIKPAAQERYFKTITEAENFFKHADRDPEATHLFKPEGTPFFLMDAVIIYEELTGEAVPIFKVFSMWMLLHFPQIIKEERQSKFAENQILLEPAKELAKMEFFATFLPVVMKQLGI
jgi:hypothetical protein